jgi:hypothetical protein
MQQQQPQIYALEGAWKSFLIVDLRLAASRIMTWFRRNKAAAALQDPKDRITVRTRGGIFAVDSISHSVGKIRYSPEDKG